MDNRNILLEQFTEDTDDLNSTENVEYITIDNQQHQDVEAIEDETDQQPQEVEAIEEESEADNKNITSEINKQQHKR